MSFISEIQAALDEATAILTDGSPTPTINYKGVDYPAIINDIELSNTLDGGGFVESLASVAVVSKSVMTTPPTSGEIVFIGSKKARVETVKADAISFQIHCRTAVK